VEKGDSVSNYDTGLYFEQKGSQSIDLMVKYPVTKPPKMVRLSVGSIYCFAYPYSQSQNSQPTGAALERENSGFSAILKK